jgi:hypothetical protein
MKVELTEYDKGFRDGALVIIIIEFVLVFFMSFIFILESSKP